MNRKIETPILHTYETADELFDYSVTSTTGCTGLIPSLPESEEDAGSYTELYKIAPQEDLYPSESEKGVSHGNLPIGLNSPKK